MDKKEKMNTLDIDWKITVPGFLGAHAYDAIPPRPRHNHSMVVNTSSSQEPGDHWLAIACKDNTIYFMDSYGRSMSDFTFSKDFRRTIKDYVGSSKVIHNKRWLQSLTSNACGDYAVYFIEELFRSGFNAMLSVFTDNAERNDNFVFDYVNKVHKD